MKISFKYVPAMLRGSVRASHHAAPSSTPSSAQIYSLLLNSWTVEKMNPSCAYARDFANAVSGEGLI